MLVMNYVHLVYHMKLSNNKSSLRGEPAIRMAVIRRMEPVPSVTSRVGAVHFANHIIRENNSIY